MLSSKKPKTSQRSGSAAAASDPRFASIATDPRYRLPSTKNARVGVDKRFSRMFKDEDFSRKAKVDRYGRKVSKGSDKKELQRLYKGEEQEEDDEDEEEEDEEPEETVPVKGKPSQRKQLEAASASEDSDEADEDGQVEAELKRVDLRRDRAREGGFSSSEDDSSSDEEDELEDEDAELAEEGQAEVPMGDASSRLAVVNLDWDNIRASDLMAVAQSFIPTSGTITNVTIYPSEYGKERIEQEELDGPPREIFASSSRQQENEDDEEDSDEEEEKIKKQLQGEDKGEEFDTAKLRQYQLDRLRYYYAVITCDSAGTAKAIYDEMDSREYLTSANFFDLRFVPDEVSFEDDKPRDECKQLPSGYKPNEFVTEALTHSKVRLTWDDDDTTRKEVQKRAFSRAEIDENDLQAYIGSESSDSEGETANDKAETQRQKMRAALGLSSSTSKSSSKKNTISSSAPVGDMQITFTSGLSGPKNTTSNTSNVFENSPPPPNETTKERYIRKEKARKAARRERSKASREQQETTAGTLEEPGLASTSPSPDPEPAAHEARLVSATAAADAPIEEDGTAEDPFDDPFFADPAAAREIEKKTRKQERVKKREEKAKAAKVAEGQRKELELLMLGDGGEDGNRGFDMNEIAKAEKAAKRKGKGKGKGRKGKSDVGDVGEETVGGDFEMQTEDPRFARLFESHEYAIDPTNPRFKGTQGMKALLEEGRKKRKAAAFDENGDVVDTGVEVRDRVKKSKRERR